jgi:erythromycin esterase
MRRAAIALLLVLFTLTADAAPRRRASRSPSETPASWLAHHATILRATALTADRSDLEPLRRMIGNASVVALGDGTHGTHEFYTVKLRLLDFLVREMGFTALAFEAPFPITERINRYVLGGDGEPRALLRELHDRLNYFFWNTEEVLATIEWMRDYNLHRGDAPPVEIAGVDSFDQEGGVEAVLAFLSDVDPAAAERAANDYACVLARDRSSGCRDRAAGVRDRLLADGARFAPITVDRAHSDVLQHAAAVLTFFNPLTLRETTMSDNLFWIREHRSTNGRVVLWAHQEHVGTAPSQWVPDGVTAGMLLADRLGGDYFVIGTLAGTGAYALWERSSSTPTEYVRTLGFFALPGPQFYEWQFRQHGAGAMLIPMTGTPPSWLSTPALYRTAGNTTAGTFEQSLPEKMHAVIYVDITTPTRPLP